MPKLTNRVPSYRHHKPSGRAVVTLNGRDIYLGKYKSAASRTEYNRLIAEWTAANGEAPAQVSDLTIAELLAAFLKHAESYYRKPSDEVDAYKRAMKPLKELYARTLVADFGPLSLKGVRQKLVAGGAARTYANQSINRIRHIFKWGVENELVESAVLHGLQAVAPLKRGRTDARETEPIRPVPDAFVDAILDHVSPVVAAMIGLQRITGMRSGEVTIMRGCDINTSGTVWEYTPETHKTAWHGHERTIYIGPKAQEIIRQYLRADTQSYLFSPAESVAIFNSERSRNRKTPLSCGNKPGSNRKGKSRRKFGERYNTMNYRQAITRGIEKANKVLLKEAERDGIPSEQVALIPHWHPHQLRHNAATSLRREYGIEIARIILGHRSATITETYAEIDRTKAIDVMQLIG